jgi:hypothetical protein
VRLSVHGPLRRFVEVFFHGGRASVTLPPSSTLCSAAGAIVARARVRATCPCRCLPR